MEVVPFGGWLRNARIVCNQVEMLVTLEVGPRIIRYGFIGGPNEMAVHDKDAGHSGGEKFHSYGGHRLWIGPEDIERTYQPDNEAVEYVFDDDWHVFTTPTDKYHLQKQIRIKPDQHLDRFILEHRIYNRGAYSAQLAPWTPTQFAPGGKLVIPQHEHIPHGDKFLPARPLVLWNYTDMADPRWSFGSRVIGLKWMDAGPTKAGMLVEQGIVAFTNHGHTHVRRFACESGAPYTDFGCNFETFTRQDMFEVETLGPLSTVDPGDFAGHQETWYLIRDTVPPEGDADCAEWLSQRALTLPF